MSRPRARSLPRVGSTPREPPGRERASEAGESLEPPAQALYPCARDESLGKVGGWEA